MVQAANGVPKAGLDVLGLQIRYFGEYLFWREPRGQELQNICDPNPHSTNAGPAAALLRMYGDAFGHS